MVAGAELAADRGLQIGMFVPRPGSGRSWDAKTAVRVFISPVIANTFRAAGCG